jgi:hypothetical protein
LNFFDLVAWLGDFDYGPVGTFADADLSVFFDLPI